MHFQLLLHWEFVTHNEVIYHFDIENQCLRYFYEWEILTKFIKQLRKNKEISSYYMFYVSLLFAFFGRNIVVRL